MNTERYTVLNTANQVLNYIEQTINRMAHSAPHVWISVYSDAEIRAQAKDVAHRLDSGEKLPLAGVTVAVKDNIDVLGLATTCAAPWTSRMADRDATCVARLREAGAIVLGKTNMDQFATGLVGTRSPYGVTECVDDHTLVSGGSSSGSAVAVASRIADIALGTDTAGSGRVPAAFNGIYGIKPTIGMIPVTGVTPACPSFDVVAIFCRDLYLGQRALSVMSGPDEEDAHIRPFCSAAPLAMSDNPVLLAPIESNIEGMDAQWLKVFNKELCRLESLGCKVKRTDVSVLLEAARLLYGGSLVAERFASIGDMYAPNYDPKVGENETVRSIVMAAGNLHAYDLVNDQQRLIQAKAFAQRVMDGADALVLPTTTRHPSIRAVLDDPVAINSDLGRFTNFVNLLDFSGIAVPCQSDPKVGITLLAQAFHEYALIDLACTIDPLMYENRNSVRDLPDGAGCDVFVVGEHMRGLSLNRQLQELGAAFTGTAKTTTDYRLVKLDTEPVKPTLIRISAALPEEGHAEIEGEVWRVPRARIVDLLTSLPHPMSLGPVDLADGRTIVGFVADAAIYECSQDISVYGSWRKYRDE